MLSRSWIIRAALAGLALAVVVHLAVVYATPYVIGWATIRKANLGTNRLYHGRVKRAPRDIVPYDNPHNMSSFLVYDVSRGPVRITASVPAGVPYWSVAVNGYDTDQLFVINDLALPAKTVTLVIVRDQEPYEPRPGEHVVRSPGNEGFVLVRMLLPALDDPALVERLARVQKTATVEVLSRLP